MYRSSNSIFEDSYLLHANFSKLFFFSKCCSFDAVLILTPRWHCSIVSLNPPLCGEMGTTIACPWVLEEQKGKRGGWHVEDKIRYLWCTQELATSALAKRRAGPLNRKLWVARTWPILMRLRSSIPHTYIVPVRYVPNFNDGFNSYCYY